MVTHGLAKRQDFVYTSPRVGVNHFLLNTLGCTPANVARFNNQGVTSLA